MPKAATLLKQINVIHARKGIARVDTAMEAFDKASANALLVVAYEGQREIKDRHVTYLKDCWKSGEFNVYEPITIVICTRTGRVGLANGNHRMRMIVDLDVGIFINVTRIYTNDFDADFAWFYATFDKGKNRTTSDSLAIFGTHRKFHITPAQADKIAKGASIVARNFSNHQCGVDYSAKSTIHQNELLKSNAANGAKYFDDIKGASKEKFAALNSQDMIAVALKMYENNQADQTKVRQFWSSIANGLFASVGEATKILAEAMTTTEWKSRPKDNKRQVVESMFSRWLAKEECKKLSPYKKPDAGSKKRKSDRSVTVIGSNNTISI